MIVALVPLSSVYLRLGVFLVLIGSLLAHVKMQPYIRSTDNHLESIVLGVALLRFMLSLLAGLSTSTGSTGTLSSLLSMTVLFCVVFVLSSTLRTKLCARFQSP